jgi:DUF917 family protein
MGIEAFSWVSEEAVEAISIGAGVLGCGGGGDTYTGKLQLLHLMRTQQAECRVISAGVLEDDDLVVAVGDMGAPTVSMELIHSGEEYHNAIRLIERYLGETVKALVIAEIGGANALTPLRVGIALNLPVVNGDGMGRAFPELQMDTFNIGQVRSLGYALADVFGNVVYMPALKSANHAELFARSVVVEMGGSSGLVAPIMRAKDMKATIIPNTLTTAKAIGEQILRAQAQNQDPLAAVADYTGGRVLFRGKVIDVDRRNVSGFTRGRAVLAGLDNPDDRLEVAFQNEYLVAFHNGELVCIVPDLISILTLEEGMPLGVERLRYGLRVAVLGMPAPPPLRTPQALAVVGPTAFGYDLPALALPARGSFGSLE